MTGISSLSLPKQNDVASELTGMNAESEVIRTKSIWLTFLKYLLAMGIMALALCAIFLTSSSPIVNEEVQNLSPHALVYKTFIENLLDISGSEDIEDLIKAAYFDEEISDNTDFSSGNDISNLNYSTKPTTRLCHSVPVNLRFDCYPMPGASQRLCEERGCCWMAPSRADLMQSNKSSRYSSKISLNVPYCFYPPSYSIYNVTGLKNESNGLNALMHQTYKSGFPKDVPKLKLEVRYETCSRLRVRILDANHRRWESPLPIVPSKSSSCHGNTLYEVYIDEKSGNFVVYRKNDSVPLFDTRNAGPLVFSDQYIQISTLLPSPYIYGLGQHLDGLLLDLYWKKKIFWNADGPPIPQNNLYGSHPFYLGLENSGMAYGVFLLNSNAMDVILQPSPGLTFRAIGGIIDMYVFLGSSPSSVVSQYTEVVGKPFMPPYWSLGYHQCRFGYNNLQQLEKVWSRTREAKIPFDVQWSDIDYMTNQNDFTYDNKSYAGLPDFVHKLHDLGMHYVIIVDPGISAGEAPGSYYPYELGIKDDIFIKNSTDQLFIGKVWNPLSTVFPDFTLPRSLFYWRHLIQLFRKELAFDGLWIDMNEPANFWDGEKHGCPKESSLEHPYYLPSVAGGVLAHRTLCATAKHYIGAHYDVHNLYAISEAIMTYSSLKMTEGISEPFIITRASSPGLGKFAGHWTGDIFSDWFNLRKSVADILTTGILGIPMIGADICGFNGNTTSALCNRWMQLGAFYPFSRNHNTDNAIDQDPVAMGDLVVRSSRKALVERYTLLPFLYTLFYQAHVSGIPVARPLFFRNPEDVETYSIDNQFLWGEELMILPVLEENAESVLAYFPEGKWYDWYTGTSVSTTGKEYLVVPAPLDTIPVVMAGGCIVPCQDPGQTTTESQRNPFGIVVALDSEKKARGSLVYKRQSHSDFMKWEFTAETNRVTSKTKSCSHDRNEDQNLILGWIKVYGVLGRITTVSVNGKGVNYTHEAVTEVLLVEKLSLDLTQDIEMIYH